MVSPLEVIVLHQTRTGANRNDAKNPYTAGRTIFGCGLGFRQSAGYLDARLRPAQRVPTLGGLQQHARPTADQPGRFLPAQENPGIRFTSTRSRFTPDLEPALPGRRLPAGSQLRR